MKPPVDGLLSMIEGRGWKGRDVPISHLADLDEAIRGRYERGLFDDEFYREQIGGFLFDTPADLPDARSIVIVAVPTPQARIAFNWRGKRAPVVVPPTYVSYSPRTESVQGILAAWLQKEGYRLAKPWLPLKTLAACSGLADYGRNNICYVPGMGSFLQLVGALSDIPCDSDPWREPKALDRCESCVACMRQCPTGAVTSGRFLLRAELCLTYHNEAEGDFPDWIDPSWHHCLVGCLRCQTVCPENRNVLEWFEERAEFTEEETALFVQRVSLDRLPAKTVAKLQGLDISVDYHLVCRNLSMLLASAHPS